MVYPRRFSYLLTKQDESCIENWTVGGSQTTKLIQGFIK